MSYDDYCYDIWDDMCVQDNECKKCDEKDKTIFEIEHYFKGMVEILYGKQKFSEGELESCIDEICSLLQMNMPQGTIQVEKKRPSKAAFLENWLTYNKEFLKQG